MGERGRRLHDFLTVAVALALCSSYYLRTTLHTAWRPLDSYSTSPAAIAGTVASDRVVGSPLSGHEDSRASHSNDRGLITAATGAGAPSVIFLGVKNTAHGSDLVPQAPLQDAQAPPAASPPAPAACPLPPVASPPAPAASPPAPSRAFTLAASTATIVPNSAAPRHLPLAKKKAASPTPIQRPPQGRRYEASVGMPQVLSVSFFSSAIQFASNAALRAWHSGTTQPRPSRLTKELAAFGASGAPSSSWRAKQKKGCVDTWTARYPQEVLSPTGHSCAWAVLRGSCASLAYQCNASCASCRAGATSSSPPGKVKDSSGDHSSTLLLHQKIRLQVTSTHLEVAARWRGSKVRDRKALKALGGAANRHVGAANR